MKVFIALFGLWAGSALALVEPPQLPVSKSMPLLTGTLYSLEKDAAELFKFKRTLSTKDSVTTVERSYTDLQGNEAVHETVIYTSDKLTRYEVKSSQTGDYAEITIKDGRAHFLFKDKAGKEKRDDEELEPNTLLGEQIPLFIEAHWDTILNGDSVGFRLLVEDRLETVGFKLKKDSIVDGEGGRKTVTVKMVPTSIFIQMIVKPLYFVAELENGKIFISEYRGRTKPRKQKGDNSFDTLDTRTVFHR